MDVHVRSRACTCSRILEVVKLVLWRIYIRFIPYKKPKETFVVTGVHHSGTTIVQHLVHTAYTGRSIKSRLPEWLSFNAAQPIVVKVPFRGVLKKGFSTRNIVKLFIQRRNDPFHVSIHTRSTLILCVRQPPEILSSLARRFPDQCKDENFLAELQSMTAVAGLFKAHRGKKIVVNIGSLGDGKVLLKRLGLNSTLSDAHVPTCRSHCPTDLDHDSRRQWQALQPPSPKLISKAFDGIDSETTTMIKDSIAQNENSLRPYTDLLQPGVNPYSYFLPQK